MKKYEIYCSEEQSEKAYKLGAPLNKAYRQDGTRKLWYTLPYNDPNWQNCDAYYIPTAAQMIGWLESKKGLKYFCVEKDYDLESEKYSDTYSWRVVFNDTSFFSEDCYETRQEATIAAIDAALEYLTEKSKVI